MEDKKYLTLSEVKDVIAERQNDGELTAEQKLALEHSQKFARVDTKKWLRFRGQRGQDSRHHANARGRCQADLLEREGQR